MIYLRLLRDTPAFITRTGSETLPAGELVIADAPGALVLDIDGEFIRFFDVYSISRPDCQRGVVTLGRDVRHVTPLELLAEAGCPSALD